MLGRVICLLLLLPLTAWAQTPLSEGLRARLELPQEGMEALADGGVLHALPSLRRFYQTRLFRPAWLAESGTPGRLGELLAAIEAAADHGLNPTDYHHATLARALNEDLARAPETRRIELELLASDAWLLLASHYLVGRIDPVSIDPEWVPSRRIGDLPERLAQSLADGGVRAGLEAMLPQQPGYARLVALLRHYRQLASATAWPKVPLGDKLEANASGPRVAALRARLRASGEAAEGGDLYDPELVAAVRAFQSRHGLDADGVVGAGTLAALNFSPAQRVAQIEANLERWRWMPEDLGRRHLRVNIADFHLELWQDGAPMTNMKVIVGKPYRRTPLFSDRVRYLVFNPAWEVPPSIAVQDKLPLLRKDPEALRRNRFQLLQGSGATEREVDPTTVDWKALGKGSFPYRLRQLPGKGNAIGKVKIMFPNRFNVYLHDTSNPELFTKDVRTFSSGCIRVQRPLELSTWLLAETPNWPAASVAETYAADVTRTVFVNQPVPVHLQYATAWVGIDGSTQFRDDIYQRDAPLIAALHRAHGEKQS